MYQEEGLLAFYKGNGAQIIRIFPYAAIQFTSFETYTRLSKPFMPEKRSFFNNLVCGSLAGMTAVTCTYPLDVIRSRLAFQYKGEETYKGITDALKKIYQVINFNILLIIIHLNELINLQQGEFNTKKLLQRLYRNNFRYDTLCRSVFLDL